MTPNLLLIELAEQAAMARMFLDSRKMSPGKPGEAFNRLPEEQKAVLRSLKSGDIDVRFETIKHIL